MSEDEADNLAQAVLSFSLIQETEKWARGQQMEADSLPVSLLTALDSSGHFEDDAWLIESSGSIVSDESSTTSLERGLPLGLRSELGVSYNHCSTTPPGPYKYTEKHEVAYKVKCREGARARLMAPTDIRQCPTSITSVSNPPASLEQQMNEIKAT
ncbi:hypothetical protein BDZ91DRAFT_785790 [Kalaharituber pfeilii]|nr:hypothetical protein BDZ91DRAFT_785790 [Kalaharituber pfeilii]